MSALGGEFNRSTPTPSNLVGLGGERWRGIHGHGSRRSRGQSLGAMEERSMCGGYRRALARRSKSGVYRVLALHGGIAPTPRRRAPRSLRLEKREEISRALRWSVDTADRTGPCTLASTVSREIRRNGGCSAYRASWADRYAWQRSLRPKPCRLARHASYDGASRRSSPLQWSPKQISGWLERQFPADPGMRLSHERSIEVSLFRHGVC